MCRMAGIIGPDANEIILIQLLKPISHRRELNYLNEVLVNGKGSNWCSSFSYCR